LKKKIAIIGLGYVGLPLAVAFSKKFEVIGCDINQKRIQECFQYLGHQQGNFPISEKASNEVMSIPMNAFLTNEQIDYIIYNIRENS